MALVDVDDQWRPSLAPIRTTAINSAFNLPSDTETYQLVKDQTYRHDGIEDRNQKQLPPATASAPSYNASPDPSKPSDSSCCPFRHSPFDPLLPNCFPCVRPSQATTSPHSRRCRCVSGHMRRKRLHLLRSLTFLLPAGGRMQSFYSSTPTAKAQLSGSFHRTSSGKTEHFMSPSTSFVETSFTSQLSGRHSSQFSSPRTPASSKVQHCSGSFPSPRTPYASSLLASPSIRHKRPNFTLAMPPGMMYKKNAVEQVIDEPSSPHVTCIGRVKQKTHCKKILQSDTVDFFTQRRRVHTGAQKEETSSKIKKKNILSDAPSKRSSEIRSQPIKSVTTTETSILEACRQKLGRSKLLSLHKLQSHREDACNDTYNVLFDADSDQARSGEGPVHEAIPHKSHGKENDNPLRTTTNCMEAAGNSLDSSDSRAPSAEMDQRTQTCMHGLGDVEEHKEDESGGGELQHAEAHQEAARFLFVMRSTGSRRFAKDEINIRHSSSINHTS